MPFTIGNKPWNMGLTKDDPRVAKNATSISKAVRGSNNHKWKGDHIKSYTALHAWIRRNKKMPKFCEKCKKSKPYDLANISGNYKRDINDYEWLCRKCHMKKDGRSVKVLSNLIQFKKYHKKEDKKC